jgi:hypothetical protein
VISIEMTLNATIVLSYPPWPHLFLEATIENWAHETIVVDLDSQQNVVVSGSQVTLTVVDSDSPHSMEVWVIEQFRCPHIILYLPNLTSITARLQSNSLAESVCTIARSSSTTPAIAAYGLNASDSRSAIEVYAGLNFENLTVVDVCLKPFCRSRFTSPVFARLRIEMITSAAMFLQILGPATDATPTALTPLPFYNFSGRYEFGSELDLLALDRVDPLPDRKGPTIAAFFATVCLCAIVAVVGIVSRRVATFEPKSPAGLLSSVQAEVVLNQYCPDSSARLLVPVSTSQ